MSQGFVRLTTKATQNTNFVGRRCRLIDDFMTKNSFFLVISLNTIEFQIVTANSPAKLYKIFVLFRAFRG